MLASDAGSLPASFLSSGITGVSLEFVSSYIKDGTEMEKMNLEGSGDPVFCLSGTTCPFPQQLTSAKGPEHQSHCGRRVLVAFT